jgi:hypothetical protein
VVQIETTTDRLCSALQRFTATSGVGIMLIDDEVPRGPLAMTNEVSAFIEELQFTLGEGPCFDAHRLAQPIAVPDLAATTARWSAFIPPVLKAGVRAIFGFPLQVGAVRIGAMDLYRDQPGELTDDQHEAALVMADVVVHSVLATQAEASPGELAIELELMARRRHTVDQASGMVAEQLGASPSDALIRLRARAFAEDRLVADLARDVVARRLRFDAATGEGNSAQ